MPTRGADRKLPLTKRTGIVLTGVGRGFGGMVAGRGCLDDGVVANTATGMHVTLHLVQQATMTFESSELWPMHGPYLFGADMTAFAEEVMRRFRVDEYLGFHSNPATITVIPRAAVRRIDFATVAQPPTAPSAIG